MRTNISDDELINKINKDENLEQSVILLFNYWDLMRVSVIVERVDEKLLKKLFASIFCEMYLRFKPWIDLQKEYKNDFAEFYERWRK